ncbi:ATP-binding protein [Nocardia sp. NPDC057668]|uniref:sensor histidine kinase n=1 Tax=Nocardia sp. NPDC057668 TaxID=3346202 RepID=UPI00366CDDA3
MSTPATPANWIRRWRVQSWFGLVLLAMVLVVGVGAVLSAVATSHTARVSDRINKQIQPAVTEAYRLQGALVDQQTGVRGYILGADPVFLEPFTVGTQEQTRATERLRNLLQGRADLLAGLDAVERSAAAWRRDYAEPRIAAVTPGAPTPVDTATINRGQAAFDRLRDDFATQNAQLAATERADRADLVHKRTVRDATLAGMLVAFLITTVMLTVLVRRLVVRPLTALEKASRRVADGDFGHRITVQGPTEVSNMAGAVESMRERIVTELESARVKEIALADQAADLDAQAAELRRSNAELEQFAYVASHDLQEPLRKVASFCQLLEKRYGDQLDDRARQYIGFAVDGAKRMQVLINDLLTFSRVGRVNEHMVPTDLGRALDKALANVSTAADEAGMRLHRPERLPELVGDPTLLIMLWQNLLTNAIKFRRPDQEPTITIDCEPEPGDTPGCRVSFSDNGIGIAPEFADKVFVIFQRLHSRDEYSGTGIGLSLCRKIVEFHGGRMWIDTEYTGGTRFVFTLATSDRLEPVGAVNGEIRS